MNDSTGPAGHSEMNIRKATLEDIDALVELNRQISDLHYQNLPSVFNKPSAAERNFLLKALEDTQRLFLVSLVEEEIGGFLSASISKNDVLPFIRNDPICRVSTIVVDEQHRGKGLGKQLMTACQQWAMASAAKEMKLEVMEFNESAQDFYKALGFQTQSRILSKTLGKV